MRFSVAVGDNYEDIKKKERLFLKNIVITDNKESRKLFNQFEREIKKYNLLKIKSLS